MERVKQISVSAKIKERNQKIWVTERVERTTQLQIEKVVKNPAYITGKLTTYQNT